MKPTPKDIADKLRRLADKIETKGLTEKVTIKESIDNLLINPEKTRVTVTVTVTYIEHETKKEKI